MKIDVKPSRETIRLPSNTIVAYKKLFNLFILSAVSIIVFLCIQLPNLKTTQKPVFIIIIGLLFFSVITSSLYLYLVSQLLFYKAQSDETRATRFGFALLLNNVLAIASFFLAIGLFLLLHLPVQ